ncbi:MAG TPA: peroxiredoxin, partial [Thiothrix sp.]|nr:peroxiredoxin [Thiothrix sp.]
FQLADFYNKKNVILYFYPRDNTPGCTTESIDFSTHYADFLASDTVIFGVSRDSLKSHENFKKKYDFPFELISDPDEVVCRLFDVIKLKKMYGKEHLGIERSTFLINKSGVLVQAWRKVKVPEHVQTVLEAAQAL